MTSQTTDYAQRWPEMAANESEKTQDKMESRFTSVNSYLWTPPEHNADSFSQDVRMTEERPQEWQQTTKLPPLQQAHTPPASPSVKSLPSLADATGYASNDEPLYPERRADEARSQTPLFDDDRSPSIPDAPALPSGEELGRDMLSKLLIGPAAAASPRAVTSAIRSTQRSGFFPSNLGIETGRDALMYYFSRVGELQAIQKARRTAKLPSPKKTRSPERDDYSKRQLELLRPKAAGVTKSRVPQKPASKPRAVSTSAVSSPVQRTPQLSRKRTPKQRTLSDFHNEAFPNDKSKHKRAPPSKKIEGNTKHWKDMYDYCPPTSTLDEPNSKPLKAQWGTSPNPLDLSLDPDRAALHPQEIAVASTLRLTGAQYMANKRKIFAAALQHVKDGKHFTKTAAQGACGIDVNKASRLHEAFTRVGWLDVAWFEQWL